MIRSYTTIIYEDILNVFINRLLYKDINYPYRVASLAFVSLTRMYDLVIICVETLMRGIGSTLEREFMN